MDLRDLSSGYARTGPIDSRVGELLHKHRTVVDELNSVAAGPEATAWQDRGVVPAAVQGVVDRWRAAGSPAQAGIAWPRQRWTEAFPEFRQLFDGLPDRLTRVAVRRHCQSAAESADDAERSFLVVMTWGYGDVGYGPFRVARILADTPNATGRLRDAATALADGGAVAGYRALADRRRSRLKWLGPAFGTKFLHFCTPAGQQPALILDRLVADWLRDNVATSFNPVPWDTAAFRRYVNLMSGWSSDLGIEPDQLEVCLFTEEAARTGSQWG
jgi:hypothetical protein